MRQTRQLILYSMRPFFLPLLLVVLIFGCATRKFSKPKSTPISVTLAQNGILINGKYRILRGGSVQWFRMPEQVWRSRLEMFKAAGFNTVDMYVPWAQMQPEKNKFDFETFNIRKFLSLTQELGLFVYFRPAGYFTNEYDGGGVPYWVLQNSTKQSTEKDGLVNLRTQDPDWIQLLTTYYKELNNVVRPYFASNGGNIIAYAIENELNGFLPFAELEKVFFKNGKPERDLRFALDAKTYLGSLVSFLRNDGVLVPITTCPALGAISVTGNLPNLTPWTNIYLQDSVEQLAFNIKEKMMDKGEFDGAYVGMPSGVTETDPSPSRMKSFIAAGMDAFFAFNVVGMAQTGFRNTVVPNPAKDSIFEVNGKKIVQGFISPTIGFFHNVLDYWSAVSPLGMPREKYFDFRSANMFLDTFEDELAQVNLPEKIKFPDNVDIGANEKDYKIVYRLNTKKSGSFLGVGNETGSTAKIQKGLFEIGGQKFPIEDGNTLPAGTFPGSREDAQSFILKSAETPLELRYFAFLPQMVPILPSLKVQFSTSEILATKKFNSDTILVLYGAAGTPGEAVFSGKGLLTNINFSSTKVKGTYSNSGLRLNYHYPLANSQPVSLEMLVDTNGDGNLGTAAKGQKLQIVILNKEQAGRSWFYAKENSQNKDFLIVGPDFFAEQQSENFSLKAQPNTNIFVFGNESLALNNSQLQIVKNFKEDWIQYRIEENTATEFELKKALQTTSLQGSIETSASAEVDMFTGSTLSQRAEKFGMLNFGNEVPPLEKIGNPSVGWHWYVAEADLSASDIEKMGDELYLEHASDFISLYINGSYFTTVSPMGTAVHTDGFIEDYKIPGLRKLLKVGKNTLVAKVHIWGRGSFMFPSGAFALSTSGDSLLAKRGGGLPGIGFDASKGLYGKAMLAGKPLTNWTYKKGLLVNETTVSNSSGLGNSKPTITFPRVLKPGEAFWISRQIKKEDLTAGGSAFLPKVFSLSGKNALATIYLNGEVIGRWTSDDKWIARGSWARASRTMWSKYNPNEFPILPEVLKESNSVHIFIESMAASGSTEDSGFIENILLKANGEGRQLSGNATKEVPMSQIQLLGKM